MSKVRQPQKPVKSEDNGEHAPGDAQEPEALADTSFDVEPEEAAPPARLIPGIDLDDIALEEDYQEGLGQEESPAAIRVCKPNAKLGYFRTHPALWKNVRMLEIPNGADRGFYLVGKGAKLLLRGEEYDDVKLFPARLTLCSGRDVGAFLWPLKLPEPQRDNQADEWAQAALRICKLAETQWQKLYTKKGGSCYSHRPGVGIADEPSWPAWTFQELCDRAFEGRYLTDPDDPLIRRLLGKE
jgi:hypothetical protein